MSSGSNVFLVVTIPTHLRIMMDTAKLLQSSGHYTPVMVYYPSAVFDLNHADCQHTPHDAFIWTGRRFSSKADYLSIDRQSDESVHFVPRRSLSSWMPNRGIYRWLKNVFPFLPDPVVFNQKVRPAIHMAVSVARFGVGLFGMARSACLSLISFFRSSAVQQESRRSFVNRTWLQRFLLQMFYIEWSSSSGQTARSNPGFWLRLIRRVNSGLFSGLSDQKIFYEEISALVRSENPVLIVLPESNLFYNSQFIIRAANLNLTPVAIVPFTIVNTLEWAEAFFDLTLYRANSGWNRLFATAFPNWVLEHKGRRLILPPIYILGCEYFDMVPATPWLINSGEADAIAAESQFMSEYYLRAGIQKEKIHPTGALSDDILFALLSERDRHRNALSERFDILIRKKVVVIGLPPDQFGAGRRQDCEFDSYEDLIRFMVGAATSLSGSDASILINLHPRINPEDVAWLTALGAAIIDEPIERLIPLADVYVAVASATIRLGISCGIPVINFDAYQYDYDDFKGLAGVCEVKSKHDFEKVLDALIHDRQFYSNICAAQKATASKLCLVDGNAGKRMLSLFNSLTSPSKVA